MQKKSFLIQKDLLFEEKPHQIGTQEGKRYIEGRGKYIYINHSEVTLGSMVTSAAVNIKIY